LGKPIAVHGDQGEVPTTWVQPIGLIANELVTNAAKHGTGKTDVTYRVNSALRKSVIRWAGLTEC
jgi:two-component sensor histidine kinase